MRIILKYILNNIKEKKLRTIVMILSIMLSTILLFTSLSIGDSYESAQQKMAKGYAGEATLSISVKPDSNGNIIWISKKEVPDLPSVKNKVGIIQTPALYSEGGYFENFDVFAADLKELNSINEPRLLDGNKLTNLSENSIVLPERFTSKYKINPGDQISLVIGEKKYEFRLAAIAAYDKIFLRTTKGFNALVSKETLSKILNSEEGFGKILIEPDDKTTTAQLETQLLSTMPSNRYDIARTFNEEQIKSDAKQKSIPFYLISFFSLILSIFIIVSSYKVIMIERLPVIGSFRSIGATQKAVSNIHILEGGIYGLLGGALAIPFGLLVMKLILNGLGKNLSLGVEIPMVIKPLNILISYILAIIVPILSSLVPINRASKLPVKELVLGTTEEKYFSNKIKLSFGIILIILSVILPTIVGKNNKLFVIYGGFSLFGLIIGTIIIIPLIVNGVSFLLEIFYGLIFGNEGKLAARNMYENKNVHQNITLLFISLSAVIVISSVANFASSYISNVFAGGTVSGFAMGNMNAEFVEKVKNIKDVKVALPVYNLDNKISLNNKLVARTEAIDNLGSYNPMLNLKYGNENIRLNIETNFNKDRNILLSNDYLKSRQLSINDSVSLTYQEKIFNYKIIGTFQSRADNSEMIVPSEYAKTDFGADTYGLLAYTSDNPDAVIIQIRNLFGNKYNWSRTVSEFNKDALAVINSFLEPMKKLTYFILLLATVGVINNLIINYLQKIRVVAMYKTVGLSNQQNIKINIIEGFTSGLIGAVVGLLISYLELKTIFTVAGPRIPIEPTLNTNVFILAGLAGITITLIGSVVPILKGSTIKLINVIKFE